MCPVCTVTVIAGLGLSRILGIDDLITSIWIGGFILSFSFITIEWINKKWHKLSIQKWSLPIIVSIYLLTLIPLKMGGSIGIVRNTFWGIDKILFGVAIGTVFFLIGIWADKKERKIKGKQLFPFQKVAFPVFCLIIASVIFFFLMK